MKIIMASRSIFLLVCSAILSVTPTGIEAQSGDTGPGCYAMRPSITSQIRELTFDTSEHKLTLLQEGVGIRFIKLWDFCTSPDESGPAECGYDCNHGRGDLTYNAQNDTIVLEAVTSLDGGRFSTGLVGRFRLRKSDPQICANAAAEVRQNPDTSERRVGDFDFYVLEVESGLAKLGYLSETPDWLYTETTATALKRFQTDVGLSPTGIADYTTRAKLRRRATVGPSWC